MDIFRSSDVFVMPSLIEGFGLVYQEAMSAGLYCIGTSNTGLPDLNPPKEVAAVIEPCNIDLLVETLVQAYGRWRKGEIVPDTIMDFAHQRSWDQFREDVNTFARESLSSS